MRISHFDQFGSQRIKSIKERVEYQDHENVWTPRKLISIYYTNNYIKLISIYYTCSTGHIEISLAL